MKKDWFLFGGLFFLIWAILNTVFAILHYGLDQGFFLWVGNIALFGTAYGLLRKDKDVLLHFLAITSFTEIFWALDNLVRLITHKNLFDLVEFMYQPGSPLVEFILAHHHFFTIPVLILAVCHLKDGKRHTLKLAVAIYLSIYTASYFFPVEQNLNCSHAPCFPSLVRLEGIRYTTALFLIALTLGLTLKLFFQQFFSDSRISPLFQERVRTSFFVLTGFLFLLTLFDLSYRNTLPRFSCKAPYSDDRIGIGCKYTMDYSHDWLVLVYTLRNKTLKAQNCVSYIENEEKKDVLQDSLFVLAGKTVDLSILIHYPKKDTHPSLSAVCTQAVR